MVSSWDVDGSISILAGQRLAGKSLSQQCQLYSIYFYEEKENPKGIWKFGKSSVTGQRLA